MDEGIDETADETFMRAAIKKAREGICKGQTPFGACITGDGKMVACAHNTVWKDIDATAHAEVNAIREANRRLETVDLSGCTIYSTTEPCPMCFSAIHWAHIGKIVYGASIEDAKKAGFNEMDLSNKRLDGIARTGVDIKAGVLRKECKALFDEWAKKGGKPY